MAKLESCPDSACWNAVSAKVLLVCAFEAGCG